MAAIFVVTHGEKGQGQNPNMTEKGFGDVKELRKFLPTTEEIPLVLRGEAARHEDVRNALGFRHYPNQGVSALWGGCGSGQKALDGKVVIILAHGTVVPYDPESILDLQLSIVAKLNKLPNNTVICAGRELAAALLGDLSKAASGAVYLIATNGNFFAEPTVTRVS